MSIYLVRGLAVSLEGQGKDLIESRSRLRLGVQVRPLPDIQWEVLRRRVRGRGDCEAARVPLPAHERRVRPPEHQDEQVTVVGELRGAVLGDVVGDPLPVGPVVGHDAGVVVDGLADLGVLDANQGGGTHGGDGGEVSGVTVDCVESIKVVSPEVGVCEDLLEVVGFAAEVIECGR